MVYTTRNDMLSFFHIYRCRNYCETYWRQ